MLVLVAIEALFVAKMVTPFVGLAEAGVGQQLATCPQVFALDGQGLGTHRQEQACGSSLSLKVRGLGR